MQILTKLLQFTHHFTVLTIFVGLVGIAALSLFALSPIGYEEYAAYRNRLDEYRSAQDAADPDAETTTGEVAGTQTTPEAIQVRNLLEGQRQAYEFRSAEGVTLLKLQTTEPHDLVELFNNTSVAQPVKLSFLNKTADTVIAGLQIEFNDRARTSQFLEANNDSAARELEFYLPADTKATITLVLPVLVPNGDFELQVWTGAAAQITTLP